MSLNFNLWSLGKKSCGNGHADQLRMRTRDKDGVASSSCVVKINKNNRRKSRRSSGDRHKMYSLFAKKENAHEDSIWSVDWGRRIVKVQKDRQEDDQDGKEDEEEEKPVDVVATGGIDDLVKVKVKILKDYRPWIEVN